MAHIPYKGTGPLITDMLGGQIALTIASAVPLAPQVRSGKLRGLAVTGPKRSPAFPAIPAIAETVKGYEVVNWFGVFALAGTPKPVTERINAALNEALRTPQLIKTLQAQGAEAVGGSAADFERVVRSDFAKWGRVVKESGARVD
jgi:tripartite-type tricarboxylate transporter receptor subunit TctC